MTSAVQRTVTAVASYPVATPQPLSWPPPPHHLKHVRTYLG